MRCPFRPFFVRGGKKNRPSESQDDWSMAQSLGREFMCSGGLGRTTILEHIMARMATEKQISACPPPRASSRQASPPRAEGADGFGMTTRAARVPFARALRAGRMTAKGVEARFFVAKNAPQNDNMCGADRVKSGGRLRRRNERPQWRDSRRATSRDFSRTRQGFARRGRWRRECLGIREDRP